MKLRDTVCFSSMSTGRTPASINWQTSTEEAFMCEADRTSSNAGAPESARCAQHIVTCSKASHVGFRSASATHSSHTASCVSSSEEIDPSGPTTERIGPPPKIQSAVRDVNEAPLAGGRIPLKDRYHRPAHGEVSPSAGAASSAPITEQQQLRLAAAETGTASLVTCRPLPLPGVRSCLEWSLECHGIFVEDEALTFVVDVLNV